MGSHALYGPLQKWMGLDRQQQQVNEVEKVWFQRDHSQGQVSAPWWGLVTVCKGDEVPSLCLLICIRVVSRICSESQPLYTYTPAFLMPCLQNSPFIPSPRSLLQLRKFVPFLRLSLLAIDSFLPSEISMEVFKHVTKRGEELICENKQLICGKNWDKEKIPDRFGNYSLLGVVD